MIQPIDLASLSAPAQKIAGAGAPPKLQEMAARGIAPGIRPAELVQLLVVLTRSERPEVKATAEKTLGALPEQLLAGALGTDLPAAAIDLLALAYAERLDVVEKLLAMPQIDGETIQELARKGSEAVTELIATNEQRLLAEPRAIELLYLNKKTRMSTADRLIDLAVRNGIILSGIAAFKEASLAIQNELIPEPTEEPTPDDLLFQETETIAAELVAEQAQETHEETDEGKGIVKERFLPLYRRLGEMTVSQKIRRAMLGSKEERQLLVRDHNRIIATAAVRSPMMQEDEVVLMSRNKNLSDEVLRVIGTTPEWTKSYAVKRNLVENPKTPVMISTRLIQHLRESDLRQIAKSKNVTGPVQDAARRHLDRRKT